MMRSVPSLYLDSGLWTEEEDDARAAAEVDRAC